MSELISLLKALVQNNTDRLITNQLSHWTCYKFVTDIQMWHMRTHKSFHHSYFSFYTLWWKGHMTRLCVLRLSICFTATASQHHNLYLFEKSWFLDVSFILHRADLSPTGCLKSTFVVQENMLLPFYPSISFSCWW